MTGGPARLEHPETVLPLSHARDYNIAVMRRPVVFAVILSALAGCAGIEGLVAPQGGASAIDPRTLDGRYAGTASLAGGAPQCQSRLRFELRVANGALVGEVADPARVQAPPSRFDGYLDTDGRVATLLRALGDVYVLRGRFREGRFDGTLLAEEGLEYRRGNPGMIDTNIRFGSSSQACTWTLRLSRQPA